MKRSLLVISKYWYRRGGAEIVALEHARILKERGHAVAHFAMEHPENVDSADSHFPSRVERGLLSPRALFRPFYSSEVARSLRDLVHHHKPDVAVVHNVYHQLGAAVHVELERLGIPVVQVFHDYKAVCPAYTMMRDGQRCTACRGGRFGAAAVHGCGGSRAAGALLAAESYWQWRAARTYPRVAVFAAPSDFLISRYRDFDFPFEIELLPNPAPPAIPLSKPRERVATVGFAGRLSAEKGADLVVACANLFPELQFRMAGTGELEAALRNQSGSNVEWLGWLSRDELARERESWDLALVPSRAAEVAPLVVLESLAAGVPVIVSEFGGASELAGGAGVTAAADAGSIERAIRPLISDEPGRARMAATARARACAIYSEERVGARLEELVALALRRRRGGITRPESFERES